MQRCGLVHRRATALLAGDLVLGTAGHDHLVGTGAHAGADPALNSVDADRSVPRFGFDLRARRGLDEVGIAQVLRAVGEGQARVWRLYLAGGALTFEEGRMGVDQILAVRRSENGRSGMPRVRRELVAR
mgnify:CR=1 FL=1